jgi:sugar-specific transcriptional regulator TrmB
MLNEILKKLGFTEKEATIYLTIVENGKIAPANISIITKINRATIYSVAKELIKKGVIVEDLRNTTTYYSALPFQELETLIKREEIKISEKKKLVKEAISELRLVPKSKTYSVPKIRFVDEENLNDFLYKQLPTWVESALKTEPTWWGYQDHTILEEYKDWVEFHWRTIPKEISLKVLTNKKEIEERAMSNKEYEGRRQVKFWKKSFEFTTTQVVIGDYILMIMTNQHPHYLVEICDSVMAYNTRELFKGIWEDIQ